MLKWDIWQLRQDEARNSTNPKQPNDATKERRYYLIISPNSYLRRSQYVVCIPIQTHTDRTSFSVEIKTGSSGLHYNSFARCTDYYTFDKNLFVSKKVGHISKSEQDDITFAIREFYGIL